MASISVDDILSKLTTREKVELLSGPYIDSIRNLAI